MGGLANFCELISITSGSIAKLAFKNEKKIHKIFHKYYRKSYDTLISRRKFVTVYFFTWPLNRHFNGGSWKVT